MTRVVVDREVCMSAGVCEMEAPEVFELDADGAALVPLEGYGSRWLRLVTPDDHRLN